MSTGAGNLLFCCLAIPLLLCANKFTLNIIRRNTHVHLHIYMVNVCFIYLNNCIYSIVSHLVILHIYIYSMHKDVRQKYYCMGSQPEIASSGYEHSMKMDGRAKDRENYYTFGGSQKCICSALIKTVCFQPSSYIKQLETHLS